jgi:hypothetical protein
MTECHTFFVRRSAVTHVPSCTLKSCRMIWSTPMVAPFYTQSKVCVSLVQCLIVIDEAPCVGALGCLCIVPSTASIVNQVLTKFLSRLPRTCSEIRPPETSTKDNMTAALNRLSELMGDPTIATRDPTSSLSFSCLSSEVIQSQKDAVDFYGKDEWKAFSPLGPDGRPIRK